MRREKGMTILEVLMASAIFSIVAMAVISGLNHLFRGQRRVRMMTTEDRLVASLINNIRSNMNQYQSSFEPANMVDEKSNEKIVDQMLEKLPIAFSESTFAPVEQCEKCPGRLGFVLQPFPGMPSLYRVEMHVMHDELYGKGYRKKLRFVASFK